MDRFEEAKAKIKDAVDLVALVERYLPLKRAGRNMVGLCPFHAEKTPSFTVTPATQHYKCFGCGKAGDVFSFVMDREGLDFRAAFELLAARAGIALDSVWQKGGSERGVRTAAAQALAAVGGFFQASLQSAAGDGARDYLERRGLMTAAASFGLGFHPPAGELLHFARARKLPIDVLQAAGLLGRDGQREMFAGRVMFPILDEGGRIVGFGGRVLAAEQQPKYLNSPESPFFNKRRLLFGLRQVKELGVRKLIVVEGYTDVIACHLAGFTGAVATLGTSLTADHARMLLRYASEGVVLLFDGDRAGRQAAERALRELNNVELPVSIAFMDEGIDPADLLHVAPGAAAEQVQRGRARMAEILAGAQDPIVAWFKLLRSRYDFRDAVGASRAAQECANLLAAVDSPVRREAMLRRMAPWFGGDEGALRRLIRPRAPAAAAVAAEQGTQSPARPRTAERPKGRRLNQGWRAAEERQPLNDVDVSRLLAGTGPTSGGAPASNGPPAPDPQDTSATANEQPAGPGTFPPSASRALRDAEIDLLACVLAQPDLHPRLAALEFYDPQAVEALVAVRQVAGALRTLEQVAQAAFTYLSAHSPPAAGALAEAVDRAHHIREPALAFASTAERRRQYLARREARAVRVALEEARMTGDMAKVDDLTRLFYEHLRSPDRGTLGSEPLTSETLTSETLTSEP